MPVHKISGAFFKSMQVEWPCPMCGQKTLQIIPETFVLNDTHDTIKHRSEDWFEPDMHRSIFSCMARCSRRQCGEVVACSGDSGWELQQGWDEGSSDYDYYQWYHPKTFFPSLHPFELPAKCPEEITEPLQASFSIFLMQPGAAANLIRISVERMLTAMGVDEKNEKGKRIVLHTRLEMLPALYELFKGPLMAIKFLGNAGSHTYDKVKIKDIEDAFEIMEYVVNDLFSGRKESVEVLTKRLSDKFQE
ncbi:TPA: DUF4145 domain-containing protein [Klebsiella michiganensis]|uniref:DUF4145 domain-containing protein n=1 Tax=Klebsiella michiganensis TaxID=1134687 RepID=A0AB35PUQ6_9ENTR|nr:DUF4145 domain-containing protein [Klebsiella michiganensis]HDU4103823.1 DUF4145 domain-containing protein [Klebsiella pneumoniae subsp. pneumoniae]HEP0717703.1 DUF4145 domain-containing protein [Klebsiella pneumoniae subsp. ozaenae]MDS7899532.1 DUF4145 domain-containing protein [Klebsiella michiganensis]HBM3218075.1 DUF4145 domain-containing protein [Klebsiella michiganensis]HDX9183709.1 DUF4145 domain-containing protein [Klebsiella michiganensis]